MFEHDAENRFTRPYLLAHCRGNPSDVQGVICDLLARCPYQHQQRKGLGMASEASVRPSAEPRQRARLVDVAERAGVTKSVVSRLMNDDTTLRIRPETRERVLAIAAELGYRPNATARALSVSRTRAFALLIPDLSNSVYAAITRGAFRRARDHGYVLLIAEDGAGDDDDASYAELVTAGRVDGLLVASSRPDHPLVERLLTDRRGVAHVFFNREVPGSNRNVRLDMRGASALVVDYLHSWGHERIGMVTGPLDLVPAQRRLEGFQVRMGELGLDSGAYAAGAFNESGGCEAAHELFDSRPELTALYASTFPQAIGVMKAVRDRGLRVPDDISLIGYDDLPMADFLDPPLTTLAMPLAALGAAAVDALVDQIDGRPAESRQLDGGYEIVVRRSVGAPSR
ncbi:LacI family DNA-binding transcriptional regulator [Isoptericola sp. BMS4]|uniref:LacI family DNA-binding transcriptional regulator n=1 Tax=Isoptericola sp. BMS4 TaxID=2527875 RepID=UPI001F10E459|nr:LacI family DNA-binding transcriptional regulator [Isoptericola sp. BMS4]